MNRIKKLFQKNSEKLMPFITAGYPKLDSTVELVLCAEECGADMVEIGIPFSDPQADGPIIQKASQIALNNGITLEIIFNQVRQIREKSDIPIALMGYYNPILKMGQESFIKECTLSDVDGIILPDLPLEEAKEFCDMSKASKISPILLVAPNSSKERIKKISELAGDLIYAVSILGITGNELSSKTKLEKYLNRVRESSHTPFVVGFGISTREDVKWFNKHSDGAVVGSAIIEKLTTSREIKLSIKNYLRSLKGKTD